MKEYLLKGLFVVGALLVPVEAMVATTFLLVFADMLTGVARAVKTKQKITSGKLRNTLSKLFIYELLIVVTYFTQENLLHNALPIVNFLTGVIALSETKSLVENCEIILGTNIFDSVILKLGSKSTKFDPVSEPEVVSSSTSQTFPSQSGPNA